VRPGALLCSVKLETIEVTDVLYKKYGKRTIDIAGAVILAPAVLLVCGVAAPLIKLEDGGDVFYRAQRRGKNGRIFSMYKLRSMKMNAPDIRHADYSTYNSEDDPRVTKVGKFLRKTSLDELPQILNILKGDMSFIGPRPVTTNRPLEDFDRKRWIRLQVKPGITGYSQAYFRNSIGQEEKLQYDADYAENVSFMGDMKIILKTIETIVSRKNVYESAGKTDDIHEVDAK
jgi:lipopolysaccharide/colanic/teichoic acid biosynthesis glycosyltransferase